MTLVHFARRATLTITLLMSVAVQANPSTVRGKVIDAKSGTPIAGAFITFGDTMVQTDAAGAFVATGTRPTVGARAWGYDRDEMPVNPPDIPGASDVELRLMPISPKSLYLSFWGVASKPLSQGVPDLIASIEVNSLVVDVKGDRAMVAHRSAVPLAAQVGAQKAITMPDMKGTVAGFKAKGIYTIARIVVFKDELLAAARPALTVKATNGEIYRDKENLMWVDPNFREVWDYNIAIAMEATAAGFDEIQFDYVRFPDATGIVYSKPNTEAQRVGTIVGFLAEARKRLYLFNVYISADVFGYLCWVKDDLQIGQKLETVGAHVDYLAPMLYPSGFSEGIPGAATQSPCPMTSSIVHWRQPVNAPASNQYAFGHGYKGSAIMDLISDHSMAPRSAHKSRLRRISAAMAGCCGILAMSTRLRALRVGIRSWQINHRKRTGALPCSG